jgi:hypothetical protein
LTQNPRGKGGEEEREEHEKITRRSHTHANPIHSILTPVARWTTPIESPGRDAKVEFPARYWCWRKEIGEGERVTCTRISLNHFQINNKECLDYRGMLVQDGC